MRSGCDMVPGQLNNIGERRRRRMRVIRKLKLGPLFGFKCVSLLGFIFFDVCLGCLWLYADEADKILAEKFKTKLGNFGIFIVLSSINAFALLITFFQLVLSKPTSRKVLIPIVIFTSTAFVILIALDFYLELKLSHMTPRESLTKSKGEDGKKGKARFKMGYLIIYVCLCIVAGFMYLCYKDFEDFLEKQKKESEERREITISHIT